jgi:serine/threonine protein kinase
MLQVAVYPWMNGLFQGLPAYHARTKAFRRSMSSDAPLLPALDSRFDLKERLGAGGMGEVFRAWDRLLQRAVALKFPKGGGPRTLERLLMEARLQSSVDHPNIGKVFEVGSLEGRPCIALQLIEGPSLDLIAARLSVEERVRLVHQVADALHAAHLQGLLHRDVKPANILVEGDQDGARKAYVTDFGLARNEEGGLSQAGQGTFLYMSPEQVSAVGLLDARSDVYSLGATLYALLADHPPFGEPTDSRRRSADHTGASTAARFYGLFPEEGDGPDPVESYRRLMEETPVPLRRLRPELPKALDTIVAKCLAKSPADRYASAKEMGEDLDRFLRGEPLQAQAFTWLDRSAHWARRNPIAFRSAMLGLEPEPRETRGFRLGPIGCRGQGDGHLATHGVPRARA